MLKNVGKGWKSLEKVGKVWKSLEILIFCLEAFDFFNDTIVTIDAIKILLKLGMPPILILHNILEDFDCAEEHTTTYYDCGRLAHLVGLLQLPIDAINEALPIPREHKFVGEILRSFNKGWKFQEEKELQQLLKEKRTEAVTKIQKVYRGWCVRRALNNKK